MPWSACSSSPLLEAPCPLLGYLFFILGDQRQAKISACSKGIPHRVCCISRQIFQKRQLDATATAMPAAATAAAPLCLPAPVRRVEPTGTAARPAQQRDDPAARGQPATPAHAKAGTAEPGDRARPTEVLGAAGGAVGSTDATVLRRCGAGCYRGSAPMRDDHFTRP